LGFLTQAKLCMHANNWLEKKGHIFRRKLPKIVENCDYNIDLRQSRNGRED
jgi:hypothetical protein